jgi:hypothetical protein
VVEGEAQLEQQPTLEDTARNARVSHSAQQDRVVSADLLKDRVGQGLAGGEPAAGSQVVLRGVDLEALDGFDGLDRTDRGQNLEALGHHLRADAVTPDDRDVQRLMSVCVSHAAQRRSRLAIWIACLT